MSDEFLPFLRQRTWRIIGGVAIACCVAMVWKAESMTARPWPLQLAYWACFVVALLAALYMVVLDLRYIRLRYLAERRELFRATLGEEEFRRALRATQAESASKDGPGGKGAS